MAELDFKQIFNSSNYTVKASNTNAFTVFRTLSWISAFHFYICVPRRGKVMELIHYYDAYSVLIPSRFEMTFSLPIRLYYLLIAMNYFCLHTERYLQQNEMCAEVWKQTWPPLWVQQIRFSTHCSIRGRLPCFLTVVNLVQVNFCRIKINLIKDFKKWNASFRK